MRNMNIYAAVIHQLPAWVPAVLTLYCWSPSTSLRLIMWFTEGEARTSKHTATFNLRVWRNLAPCHSADFHVVPTLGPQRSAFNASSIITASFDAPLMSKFKEMLAVSDKTLRRLQKEMIKHRSPFQSFLRVTSLSYMLWHFQESKVRVLRHLKKQYVYSSSWKEYFTA